MAVSLSELAHKVAGGARLSEADARQLAATTDLVTVGMVAAEARRVHGGDGVTFVRVAEIACGAPLPEAGWPATARELRITGTPASVDDAVACVRAVVARADGRAVTGFSIADLWTLAGQGASALEALARTLVQAGLVAIADVCVDDLSAEGAPASASGSAAASSASRPGAHDRSAVPATTASAASATTPTPLREALAALAAAGLPAPVARWDRVPDDPVAALAQVRALQEQTRAFRAFAPLPRVAAADPPQTGYDDVKLVALARVLLDNVPAIQVDWGRHGPKLAQVALLFGASDLDRVSPSDESPLGHRRAPLEEVQRNITAAFLQPLERDGRFDRVAR